MPDAVPRVSVLLPAYNAECYLREAVASILAQSFRDFECIIVDDGSTDTTASILAELAQRDDRLRIISRPNTGIVGALNDGLALCRGTYIARMDADDIAYPRRLAEQVAYLEQHPKCVGVGAWVKFLDPDGEPIWTWKMSDDTQTIEAGLLDGNIGGLVHPAMLLRRDAMQAVGGYRQECNYVEDYDLFLRLLERGSFSVVQECLLGYRQHFTSINATQDSARRIAIKNKLMAAARTQRGLLKKTLQPSDTSPESILLQWIELALEERNFRSARHTAWRLFKLKPLSAVFFSAKIKIVRALLTGIRIKLGGIRHSVAKK